MLSTTVEGMNDSCVVRCPVSGVQCPVSGVRCPVSGVRFPQRPVRENRAIVHRRQDTFSVSTAPRCAGRSMPCRKRNGHHAVEDGIDARLFSLLRELHDADVQEKGPRAETAAATRHALISFVSFTGAVACTREGNMRKGAPCRNRRNNARLVNLIAGLTELTQQQTDPPCNQRSLGRTQ